MKESLFEMLLDLVTQTLNELQQLASKSVKKKNALTYDNINKSIEAENLKTAIYHLLVFKEANAQSMRVFSDIERGRLTKSSYQLLVQLESRGIVSRDLMEIILTRLMLSGNHIINLQETKWTIRSILSNKLSLKELAFLDLVLYHKEDAIVCH